MNEDKSYIKVDPEHLRRLNAARERMDRHARTLGLGYVEFEMAKAGILAARAPDCMTLLGVACAEFEGLRNSYMGKIAADKKRMDQCVEEALNHLKIDPLDKKKHWTIDFSTGVVMQLIEGKWVPEEANYVV